MNTRQGLIVLIAILLLLLLGVGFFAYKTNHERNTLTLQNENLSREISDLGTIKDRLASEVDSLQAAYEDLAEENESLQGSVEVAEKKLAEKDAVLTKIKKQSAAETNNLKAQIEVLLASKKELESRIYDLQEENDSLRTLTGQLTADLESAQTENEALASLNATIQDELKRLTLANFKASAFRVEVEKKNPKLTAKSRQARKIRVSFDLTNVVKKYQGVRPLYLVITDDKGTPIKMSNPVNAKVNVNGQDMDILAAKVQEVDIEENQRLEFTHDLEEKLRSGYYRVAVYTDVGLLGASSFRLR